jgi:hypothetical protein
MDNFFPCRAQGKKTSLFPICAVNFCKTFCTCSPSSLRQDLIVKNEEKKKNCFSFGLLELEMAILNVF